MSAETNAYLLSGCLFVDGKRQAHFFPADAGRNRPVRSGFPCKGQ